MSPTHKFSKQSKLSAASLWNPIKAMEVEWQDHLCTLMRKLGVNCSLKGIPKTKQCLVMAKWYPNLTVGVMADSIVDFTLLFGLLQIALDFFNFYKILYFLIGQKCLPRISPRKLGHWKQCTYSEL